MEEFIDLEFSDPRLVEPNTTDLGSEPDINGARMQIRLGRRPDVYNFSLLFQEKLGELRKDFRYLVDYDIWLLSHVMAIKRNQSNWLRQAKSIGFKVKFPKNEDITIIDLCPHHRLIPKVPEDNLLQIDVLFNGRFIPNFQDPVKGEIISENTFTPESNGQKVGSFTQKAISTEYNAFGEGDFVSEWNFSQKKDYLAETIRCYQTILVPEGTEEITFKAMVYVNLNTFDLLVDRRKSKWISFTCEPKLVKYASVFSPHKTQNQDLKSFLKELLKKNRIEHILEILAAEIPEDSPHRSPYLLLSGNWNEMKSNYIKGILSSAELELYNRRFVDRLLEFINRL